MAFFATVVKRSKLEPYARLVKFVEHVTKTISRGIICALCLACRGVSSCMDEQRKTVVKAELDCISCVMAQALRAARMATDDAAVQRRILDAVAQRLPQLDLAESPAAISMCAYELAAELAGNPDPFRKQRREQNELALRLEPELRVLMRDSADPLVMGLYLSAAGNIIDLGTQHAHQIDIRAAVEQVIREGFAVSHLDAFRQSLDRSANLLFLLDNAGEIVFDKLLIEELIKHVRVTAVVKKGPIINDATMEDAEQVALTKVCEVIDNGGAFIGSPLSRIPSWFRERLDAADMIVGKGQGNYETVDDHPGDVYLILRAKCEIVARHMGVEYGQVGLISTRARSDVAGARSVGV